MYSSVSDAEYQFRKAKAEKDAQNAYARSKPSFPDGTKEDCAPAEPPASKGGLRGILSRIGEDDLLILAVLFLLLNENKEDDPLILIILAVLLLN